MDKATSVLVDLTQCIGCGSCTVACKLWNSLGYSDEAPATGERPVADQSNWTTLTHVKAVKDGGSVKRFVKKQCMHCEDPACVSACFAKALQKTAKGPVVYRPDLCVGCRYCMLACPFDVPKYEWSRAVPSLSKCQMCPSRLEKGENPACASVCPTGALQAGKREDLLALARKKIATGRYVDHIYGEKEAGGTRWLYLSDVPFATIGLNLNVPKEKLPVLTEEYLKWTPPLLIGGSLLFAALSFVTGRRKQVTARERREPEQDHSTP